MTLFKYFKAKLYYNNDQLPSKIKKSFIKKITFCISGEFPIIKVQTHEDTMVKQGVKQRFGELLILI